MNTLTYWIIALLLTFIPAQELKDDIYTRDSNIEDIKHGLAQMLIKEANITEVSFSNFP